MLLVSQSCLMLTATDVVVPIMIECRADKQREVIQALKGLGVTGYPVRTGVIYSVASQARHVILTCVVPAHLIDAIRKIDGVTDVRTPNGFTSDSC